MITHNKNNFNVYKNIFIPFLQFKNYNHIHQDDDHHFRNLSIAYFIKEQMQLQLEIKTD